METEGKMTGTKTTAPGIGELREAVFKNEKEKGSVSPDASLKSKEKSFAEKMSNDMGLGFNLGNTLDAVARPGNTDHAGVLSETAWFNPLTTREMIKAIKKGGFKTLRLPVTWHNHVSGEDDIVDPAWMKRVKEIVGWALEEDMYVILNTHHDIFEGFFLPDNDHIERSLVFMKNIWTQIAEEFKDVTGDRLLFESLNEIRVPRASFEWTPDYDDEKCCEAMENINKLNQLFVDVVRASGGKNSDRVLVIPGYSTSTEGVYWDGFKLPEDTMTGRQIVAAHIYSPAHFAFYLKEGANYTEFDMFSPESTLPIDERLGKLYNKFVSKGIPVNIDEFGTVDKDNDGERVKCLAYTLAKASELGIRTCYWDNGVFKGYGNGMAIFDRKNLCFPDMGPIDSMLNGMRAFE